MDDDKKESAKSCSIPAVGEGKLATCAENFAFAVFAASMKLGPVLAGPCSCLPVPTFQFHLSHFLMCPPRA